MESTMGLTHLHTFAHPSCQPGTHLSLSLAWSCVWGGTDGPSQQVDVWQVISY